MSVELHFVGLFCHASIFGNEIVIVPTGPTNPPHLFRIVVDKNMVDTNNTNALDDGVFASALGTERSFYDVTGRLVIDGVTGTTRTTTSKFDSRVPKLTDVSQHKTVHMDVLTQTLGSNLKTFIEHVPGMMDVVQSFEYEATFDPPVASWTPGHCIAAVVAVVLADNGNPIVIRNASGKQVVLDPRTSVITFWNEPRLSSAFHGDFSQYYRSIFRDSATESLPKERLDENGAKVRCADPFRVNSVECGNSQLP